jgi:hypothetical protein
MQIEELVGRITFRRRSCSWHAWRNLLAGNISASASIVFWVCGTGMFGPVHTFGCAFTSAMLVVHVPIADDVDEAVYAGAEQILLRRPAQKCGSGARETSILLACASAMIAR